MVPIQVWWAEPGPEADAALRRYWNLAYEIAGEIIGHEALANDEDSGEALAQGEVLASDAIQHGKASPTSD